MLDFLGEGSRLYLIYKEAAHNLLKHSEATFVSVHLEDRQKQWVLRVIDKGKDISEEPYIQGHRLRKMHRRALRIYSTLEIQHTGWRDEVKIEVPQ